MRNQDFLVYFRYGTSILYQVYTLNIITIEKFRKNTFDVLTVLHQNWQFGYIWWKDPQAQL